MLRSPFRSYTELWRRKTISIPSASEPIVFSRARLRIYSSALQGRPPKGVKRIYGDFECQAASLDKPRRVVAKVEWHLGELFPRVGFVVANLSMEPDWIVQFYNQSGKAEYPS
jgi:hypothetical protein